MPMGMFAEAVPAGRGGSRLPRRLIYREHKFAYYGWSLPSAKATFLWDSPGSKGPGLSVRTWSIPGCSQMARPWVRYTLSGPSPTPCAAHAGDRTGD